MECVCKVCGASKPIELFDKVLASGPREEWNLRRCKDCAHADYVSAYQKPKRRKALNASSRNWKRNNPERHAQLAREYRARNPEKIIAQNRLNYAIRKGRVQRLPCEVCGSAEKVHAHHVSYDPKDWYNVRWLCVVCHEIEHG